MKRRGNLFKDIVSIDNLQLAYQRAKRHKSWMRSVRDFSLNVDENLYNIQQSLVNQSFTTSPYKVKTISYPKEREIFILPFSPDRIVQHALMNIIEPIWDKLLVDNTTSCRKNRGVETAFRLARKYTSQYKYYLQCDVRKFYPSIDHDIMSNIVRCKIKCEETLWLIDDIIYSFHRQFGTNSNVPIGNYTSQWFGNLYLDILDKYVTQSDTYFHNAIRYIRYCDDFILFSNDLKMLECYKRYVSELLRWRRNLLLSKARVARTSQGLDFIGYKFFPKYTLLRKRVAKSLIKRFDNIAKSLNKKKVDIDSIRGKIASANGLLIRCDSYNLRCRLQLNELQEMINGNN